jgi:hypothetical protein
LEPEFFALFGIESLL